MKPRIFEWVTLVLIWFAIVGSIVALTFAAITYWRIF